MILDTNALSALVSGDREIRKLLSRAPRLAVTLITLGEFTYGMAGSRKRDELETWLEAFLKGADVLIPSHRNSW
ncbi:MAG: PIN domain-containing protein [Verrucomicrobiota bacterium]